MNRQEFLESIWVPFPAAENHWLDADELLNRFALSSRDQNQHLTGLSDHFADEYFVCGRLKLAGENDLFLESGGGVVGFQWGSEVTWLRPQKRKLEFDSRLLAHGDLVCLKCIPTSSDKLIASAVLLLVPGIEAKDLSQSHFLEKTFTVERSALWMNFLASVRRFFTDQNFIEAMTPTLVPSPGTEPYLDSFSTTWTFGSQQTRYFLPTSPEFHLKKLLAGGWTRIFEFKTCFRNAEIGQHHQPEFQMLEWYRAYRNLDAIANDVELLLKSLVEKFRPDKELKSLERTTIAQLFAQTFSGFQLRPNTTDVELRELAKSEKVQFSETDTFDDLFFRIFLEKIEPHLGQGSPLLVRGYPPSQAALSRLDEAGFADRFEIYWNGLEIANAFHELNDPSENKRRFQTDAEVRSQLEKEVVPLDSGLLRALEYGMPPAGGIALGLDRLFMALFEIDEIQMTRPFPVVTRQS